MDITTYRGLLSQPKNLSLNDTVPMKFVVVIGNIIILSFFLFKYFLQVSVFLSGHTVESDGAGLLVRGGSVRHDRQEAAADGAPQPHLHQWNVPPLLHHRRCHGSPRNILLIQTLQRKVMTVLLGHFHFFQSCLSRTFFNTNFYTIYQVSFFCAVSSEELRRPMSTTAWCSALSGRFGTPTGCSSTWPFSSPGNYSLIFSIKLVISLV